VKDQRMAQRHRTC